MFQRLQTRETILRLGHRLWYLPKDCGAPFEEKSGWNPSPGWLTGGKQKLLGISKRGNCYLRRLFVQGARAVLQFREKQSSGLSTWLAQLASRTHHNVVGVALANKLARMAWAVLAKGEVYRPKILASSASTSLACS